jgi:cell division protein FtsI (penicillin-binding protein 3)
LVAIAIAVKLTNIQWVEGDYYRKLAKGKKNFVIPSKREYIFIRREFISYFNSNYEIRLML